MNIKLENNTATSEINLEDNFVLKISTSKYGKTVQTTATMYKTKDECLSSILDFSRKKFINHGIVKRLTKDELINFHNFAIKNGDFLNPDFISQEKEKLKDI
jgi:hypothetical protein